MEGKEEERKRLNEEAEQEESKSGEGEVEGERERVEIKRRFFDRLSSEVFDDFCPTSEVESVGDCLGSSVCVPFVPLVVPAVTLPFSDVNVNVVCGFLCFGL